MAARDERPKKQRSHQEILYWQIFPSNMISVRQEWWTANAFREQRISRPHERLYRGISLFLFRSSGYSLPAAQVAGASCDVRRVQPPFKANP